MSIRITVKSTDLRPRTKKGTGEVFAYEQTAYAWLCGRDGKPEEYPSKITLTIWQRDGKAEHPAYEPGDYTLAPASFTVGDYQSLNCSPRLVRIAAQAAARAA
jgi:hypothetical protein